MKWRMLIPLVAVLAPAIAAAPLTDPLDLALATPAQATVIDGPTAGELVGQSVAAAGDWNDDGLPDLIIGSPFARHPSSGITTGVAHVIFGDATPPASLDLATLGADGTAITGIAVGDQFGRAVTGVGDWNDDGIDDIAIGAPFAQPGGLVEAGQVHIVFGRSTPPSQIDIATLASPEGVVIDGALLGDQTGFALSRAGDWNADGIDDLLIGAPNADIGAIDAGRAYVIFGDDTPPGTIPLATVTSPEATIIDGANDSGGLPIILLFGDSAGFAVSGGHDLTNDGFDDIVINAPGADTSVSNAGVTYLIEGEPNPPDIIDLALPPSTVHQIRGVDEDDQAFLIVSGGFNPFFGGSVASLGDVNGDAMPDLAIGSQFADDQGESTGEVYLITSSQPFPSIIDLAVPTSATPLFGESADDLTGRGLAAAGDFNGDGVNDMIIGAPQANPLGRSDAGTVTVMFGSPQWPLSFSLPTIDPFGLQILGGQGDDLCGLSAAGIGDWNGDGIDDIAIGSPGASSGMGETDAGQVHIVFGGEFTVPQGFTDAPGWYLYR